MLCPNCGAEVGEKIELCPNCHAARADRLAQEAKQREETEGPKEVQEPPAPPKDRTGVENPEATKLKRKLAFVALGLIGLSVFYVILQSREVTTPPTPPIESNPVQTESVPPTAEPSPAMERFFSHEKSALKWGDKEVKFNSSLAFFNKKDRKVDIAFFREALSDFNLEAIRTQNGVLSVHDLRPDLILTLKFLPLNPGCDMTSVGSYDLTFFRNPNGLVFAADTSSISIDAQKVSADPAAASLDFSSFNCERHHEGSFEGNFRGKKQITIKDDTFPVSWDLSTKSSLVGPTPVEELIYNSEEAAKSTMALWDNEKSELSIGFYAQELLSSERERIREGLSLDILADKKPDVVLSFVLAPERRELNPENIKTFGVMFFRDRGANLDFPGSEDKVGVFYVGSAQNAGKLEALLGSAMDKNDISGLYEQAAQKKIAEQDFPLKWKLNFHTKVYDVSKEPDVPVRQLETQEAERPKDAFDLAAAPYGELAVDGVPIKIKTTVAIYYPEIGDVGIGFYADDLSDSEITQIKQRKSLSSFINNKRPSLVLFLDFAPGVKTYSAESLLGYTMYFYRDPAGAFSFSGIHDALTLKRTKDQIPKGELRALKGNQDSGFYLEIRGEGAAPSNPSMFSWALKYNITATSVQ